MKTKKKKVKRQVGRPTKNIIEPMPDTPENVAKALFGIRSDGKKIIEFDGSKMKKVETD